MIRFTLPRPPSVNTMYRNVVGVGRVKTLAYKEWSQEAMAEMMAQRVGQPVPKTPVSISIMLPDSGGRADIGNYEKAVSDCLVQMGILPDDNDRYVRRITLSVGAPPDSCIVQIEAMVASIPHEGKVS